MNTVKREKKKFALQFQQPTRRTALLTVLCLLAVILAYTWSSTAESPVCSYHDETLLIGSGQEADGLSQTFEAATKNLTGIQLYIDSSKSRGTEGKLTVIVSDDSGVISSADADLSAIDESDTARIQLPKTSLKLGERYTITLSLSDTGDDTVLALKYNEDYAGMTLYKGGTALLNDADGTGAKSISRGALGADILYRHTSNVAFLLKMVIIFGATAALCALLFGRPLVDTIAVSTGIIFLVLYLAGIFQILLFGVWFVQIAACVIFIFIPYLLQIRGVRLREFVTPGVFAYCLVLGAYFLLDRNMYTGKVDDLNQWQTCVRDLWYFDKYPFHEGSFLAFPRYTPGMGTLEYLILYLYGSFREGIILFACHSIGFAYLSILYSGISWKEWHKCIPASAMVIAFPLLLYQSHFGILYVDAYLGIVGGYLLVLYFTKKHSAFKTAGILLGAIFLCMIKESGLVMAGILYLCVLLDLWHHDARRRWKNLRKLPQTRRYLLCALAAIAVFVSWEIYCSVWGGTSALSVIMRSSDQSARGNSAVIVHDEKLAYNGELSALSAFSSAGARDPEDEILRYADGTAVITPIIVLKSMAQFMFTERTYLGFSYAGVVALTAVFCMLLYWSGLFRKLQLRIRAVLFCSILGSLLYTVFMMLCYMFLFKESSPIPAARRYMGTYLLTFLIAVIGSIAVRANDTVHIRWRQEITWILSIVVLLCVPGNHSYVGGEASIGLYAPTWQEHQSIGEVFRSFADRNEHIFYVSYQDSKMVPQYDYLVFFNAVAPNLTQGLGGGWKPVEDENDLNGNYRITVTNEKFGELLSDQYTYVYLQTVNSYFREHYGSLFREENEIRDGGIYRVTSEGGKVTLIPIAYYPVE